MKKFRKPNRILSNLFIPLLVLIFNCLSLGYFLSRFLFLPSGVNDLFVSRLWKYLLVLAVLVYLAAYLSFRKKKKDKFVFKKTVEKIAAGDLVLILLPLTPVVQYILRNQAMLSLQHSLAVLAFFILLAGLYVFIIPALLGILGSVPVMMLSGLAFTFTITSMPLLSQYFSWYEAGSLLVQALFFGGTFLVVWLLYHLRDKRILRLFILGLFLLNTALQFMQVKMSTDENRHSGTENNLQALVETKEPVDTPNIYLLVYDAYVANETLLAYGMDNSSQENFLREQGFELYPQTYSIGAETLTTMNSLLDVSTETDGNYRRAVSGDGAVQRILKENGYHTYGLFTSDYYFRGISSSYDFTTPAPKVRQLSQ